MAQKIYFCGSIRGGRSDAAVYGKIVEHLKSYGAVLTEHVASTEVTAQGNVGPDKGLTEKEIHDRDMEWLKSCQAVVAEVTVPSLGVGYEIGRALDMGKRILCLFRTDSEKRLSAMIEGAQGPQSTLVVKRYQQLDEALDHVSHFFK